MRFPSLLIVALALGVMPLTGAQGAVQPENGVLHLFNGSDLEGWVPYTPVPDANPDATWRVRGNGVLYCSGRPDGYLRTKLIYTNYRLMLQWRWPREAGAGGVLLHVQDEDDVWPRSIEATLSAGHAGDFWVIRSTVDEHKDPERQRLEKHEASSEKPVGEWNTLEIRCAHDALEVFVNGVLQNRATQATVHRGHIALQSVGTPIEFRNITLHPLEPAAIEDNSAADSNAERGQDTAARQNS